MNYQLDGHKLQWHKDRVDAWLAGERIAPITIDMALTRACDYRCKFCYSQLQKNTGKRITADIMRRFLDDCAEMGVRGISLVSDGESSLSDAFIPTIVHGKEVGIDMAVGSHGLHLTKDVLSKILPLLTYLRFNISAGEPERYAEIHGTKIENFFRVTENIRAAVDMKREFSLPVTIGLQMVLMPELADQIMPMALLGKRLHPDYLVIKHCSDDETGALGVKYSEYRKLYGLLERAEALSDPGYLVKVKWSKIRSEGVRSYERCYGAPFLLQLSGSGLVAPCGCFFADKYERFHIGNIADTPFKQIVSGDRYWQVMNELASDRFNAKTMCGVLCVQDKVCEALDLYKKGLISLDRPDGDPPPHVNFV